MREVKFSRSHDFGDAKRLTTRVARSARAGRLALDPRRAALVVLLVVSTLHVCAEDAAERLFRPLARPEPPAAFRDDPWVREPIDAFVLAALAERGLRPSPEADRRTLIRRLSFGLRGLPPSPDEIERFVADPRPDAYERLVEEHLASPAYGERFTRHWLDVVRFTESHGYEYDRLRENAWQYRDRVIDFFNRDEPYDAFVRAQIAGDVIEPVTRDGIIATSFLVCGPFDQAGNIQANATQRMIAREEELEGLVGAVTQTFLGLTVNCARCHDHKYDPISSVDYYRVRAVFDGIVHGEASVVPLAVRRERADRVATLRAEIERTLDEIAAIEAKGRRRVLESRERAERDARTTPVGTLEAPLPEPIALWTFENGTGRDESRNLHGTLEGGATIRSGRLELDGKGAFLATGLIDRDLREKTLAARVHLATLDQGGGGLISIERPDGSVFDAIVFGERTPRRYIAGSENFRRTRDLDGPDERRDPAEPVHVAVTYAADGTITLYRDGERYGEPYGTGAPPVRFEKGGARILLGKRHTGGGRPYLAGAIEEAAIWDRALDDAEIRAVFANGAASFVSTADAVAALEVEERVARDAPIRRKRAIEEEIATLSRDEIAYVGERRQPEPARRLARGDVTKPAEVVAPGGLEAIAIPSGDLGLAPDAPEGERRRRFAEWITDPRQPFASRVIVNRLWLWHFGRGIVETPNDFGAAGSGASHPDLLDWLAVELIENGFSLKHVQRRILLSSTYRQASDFRADAHAIDADAVFLWRYPPSRLEAEVVRDAMLAVSGRLHCAMGGPSFRPFTVATFGSTFYSVFDGIGPDYERRTIYRMNVISGKDPFLDVLDCPDPAVAVARRQSTTTPLQSLAFMNSSFVNRQAKSLAARVERDAKGSLEGAVDIAWKIVLGRSPEADELAAAASHAKEHGLESLAWILLNSTELLYVR